MADVEHGPRRPSASVRKLRTGEPDDLKAVGARAFAEEADVLRLGPKTLVDPVVHVSLLQDRRRPFRRHVTRTSRLRPCTSPERSAWPWLAASTAHRGSLRASVNSSTDSHTTRKQSARVHSQRKPICSCPDPRLAWISSFTRRLHTTGDGAWGSGDKGGYALIICCTFRRDPATIERPTGERHRPNGMNPAAAAQP